MLISHHYEKMKVQLDQVRRKYSVRVISYSDGREQQPQHYWYF